MSKRNTVGLVGIAFVILALCTSAILLLVGWLGMSSSSIPRVTVADFLSSGALVVVGVLLIGLLLIVIGLRKASKIKVHTKILPYKRR